MSLVPGQQKSEEQTLSEFFEYIYGSYEGFSYVLCKSPTLVNAKGEPIVSQNFFEWPKESGKLTEFVLSSRAEWEVWTSPALFEGVTSATKADVKGASVYWVEFDGKIPESLGERIPEPTLRIKSSGEGHEHWYWKLDEFVDGAQLESVNRAITYQFGADFSGWDSTQVLRPPNTFNHKRQKEVKLLEAKEVQLPTGLFHGLPQPPPPLQEPIPDSIPPVEQVVFQYKFPERVTTLFQGSTTIGERSSRLMQLGYELAEIGLTNVEILSMLLNADERWGKFVGRQDRIRRLLEIVSIAKAKYPNRVNNPEESKLEPMGFLTLLATEVNIEWCWDGLLHRGGYFLLTGPSGIGKTQVTLDAAAHFALGEPFLERKIMDPMKTAFFSLEMGLVEIKSFLQTLQAGYTPEQQKVMEDQMLILPSGESINMSNDKVRGVLEEMVGDLKLEGLFIDSLGSATNEKMQDEEFRKFFHWFKGLRKRHGCFTWFIHHNRKPSGENKKPNKLGDVYGSQYITSEADTVACLWTGSYANTIQVLPLKVRLAKQPDPFHIARGVDLKFTMMTPGSEHLLKQSGTGSPGNGHSDKQSGQVQSSEPGQSNAAVGHTGAGIVIVNPSSEEGKGPGGVGFDI